MTRFLELPVMREAFDRLTDIVCSGPGPGGYVRPARSPKQIIETCHREHSLDLIRQP